MEPRGDFINIWVIPKWKECNPLKLSKDFDFYLQKVLSTTKWTIISKVVKTITIIIIIVVWWNSVFIMLVVSKFGQSLLLSSPFGTSEGNV